MKMSKKTFGQMISKWGEKDPHSMHNFFMNNVVHNLSYDDLKKIIPGLMDVRKDLVMEELDDYMDNRQLPIAETKPKTKHNYIGIEIECFSEIPRCDAQLLAIEHKISDWVEVGDDGSVEPDFGKDFELRVLIRENTLDAQLKKLAKFLKAGKFDANESCGLHIHLDMRNRKMLAAYNKLIKFQTLLFGMVSEDRQNDNEYCAWTHTFNENHRYVAINKSAYNSHKTIEIRLHQGTVDVKLMSNWIKLLLKIINDKGAPKSFKKTESIIEWLGKSHDLKTYVKKNYDPNWREKLDDGNNAPTWEND